MRPSRDSRSLTEVIRDEIRRRGPIPFVRFMELALYHPRHGYYTRARNPFGPGGDFYTAAQLGDVLGRHLAVQFREMDLRLGQPDPLWVLDAGAGRGALAAAVCGAWMELDPDGAARRRWWLVERGRAARRACAEAVPGSQVSARPPRRIQGGAGIVLANELLDALPVHRLRRREGRLVEVFVDASPEDGFVERTGPPDPAAAALAERYGAALEEGTEAEVCTRLDAVLGSFLRPLQAGYAVIVDYGMDAATLYGPRFPRGTLLAYHRHRTHEDVLSRPGAQDLTAHVNFSHVRDAARALGWVVAGETTLDRLLIALGALEPFHETDETRWRSRPEIRKRLQLLPMILPQAMGRRFRVMVLSKDVPNDPPLQGLRDPFAGGEGILPR